MSLGSRLRIACRLYAKFSKKLMMTYSYFGTRAYARKLSSLSREVSELLSDSFFLLRSPAGRLKGLIWVCRLVGREPSTLTTADLGLRSRPKGCDFTSGFTNDTFYF